jgi:hypothetical protein
VKEANKDSDSHKDMRFGNGGLTLKLNDFITTYINENEEYAN